MNLIGKSAFSATREPIDHFGSTFSWAKKAAARESKSRPRPQHTVLPSQPGQLLAFFGGHPRRPTFVDLSLGNPPSQTEKPKSPAGEQQQTTTRCLLEPTPQLYAGTPPDKQQAFKYLLPKRPNRASHTITEYVSAKPGELHREIIRCLKRHIAREIYHLLTNPPPTPNGALLRTQRHHTQITLTHAATALQTHPNRISQLERGLYHNHHLATQYQHWLTQQNPANIYDALDLTKIGAS